MAWLPVDHRCVRRPVRRLGRRDRSARAAKRALGPARRGGARNGCELGEKAGLNVAIFRLVGHLRSRPQRLRGAGARHRATDRQARPGFKPHPRGGYRDGSVGLDRPPARRAQSITCRTTSRPRRRTSSRSRRSSPASPNRLIFRSIRPNSVRCRKSFYAENKRISNRRITQELGVRLRYPTYREGLAALYASGEFANAT